MPKKFKALSTQKQLQFTTYCRNATSLKENTPPPLKKSVTTRTKAKLLDDIATLQTELDNLWNTQQEAEKRTTQQEALIFQLKSKLLTCTQTCSKYRRKAELRYRELRTARQALARSCKARRQEKIKISLLKSTTILLNDKNSTLTRSNDTLEAEILRLHATITTRNTSLCTARSELSSSRKECRVSRKRALRLKQARDEAKMSAKAALAARTWRLLEKGVYTPVARALARLLFKFGCSEAKIGEAITTIGSMAGTRVVGFMSRRTVGRAIVEGGRAAKLQVAYEMSRVKGITASGDATSHKAVNYEAMHVTLNAPNYDDSSLPEKPKTRIFALSSSVSHHAEVQLESIQSHLDDVLAVLQESPFARRIGVVFTVPMFFKALKGYHGDHAADVKKLKRLLEQVKYDTIRTELGYDHVLSLSEAEVFALAGAVKEKCVESAGGVSEWEKLKPEERAQLSKAGMDALCLRLGEDKFAELPVDVQRELNNFFYVGCSMHKELNAVVGGYARCAKYWSEFDLERPFLLANKDNDATIRLAEMSAGDSEAAERAVNASSRGGVKLTQLAGAFFRNKDDKKGAQDQHRDWFQQRTNTASQFPDVSNIRYHSTCRAACRLLAHLGEYRLFMKDMRDKKINAKFNHLEENIFKGLHDVPTLTELAAGAIFYQAISGPYALAIRGPGTESVNMLEQGPLHFRLLDHIRLLIVNPMLIFGQDRLAKYLYHDAVFEATDDGRWLDEFAMDAILVMFRHGDFPHLIPLFTTFLQGALDTLIRFTSEFVDGGAISRATAEERQTAFMPTTNDANEGLLGMWRRWARERATTIGHFMAHAMFHRNGTQKFMDAMMKPEDHAWLIRAARLADKSGEERKRRQGLTEYIQKKASERREKVALRLAKQAKRAEELKLVDLKFNRSEIAAMTRPQLDDQLDVWRKLIPGVKIKSHITRRGEKVDEVFAALDRYEKEGTDLVIEDGDAEEPDGCDDEEMDIE